MKSIIYLTKNFNAKEDYKILWDYLMNYKKKK